MKIIDLSILAAYFLALSLLPSVSTAQVNYQFNDTPRPEADVIVANVALRGTSRDLWLVGRVFNRGLKPARNVRILPTITDLNGSRYPTNTFTLTPSDVPPTSFANFQVRVLAAVDPGNAIVRATAEWDP